MRKGPGAPRGNQNAVTHGLRRERDFSGDQDDPAIKKAMYKFRDALEKDCLDRHGEISARHASLIQSAMRLEGGLKRLARWNTKKGELSLEQELGRTERTLSVSKERDALIAQLTEPPVKPSAAGSPYADDNEMDVETAMDATILGPVENWDRWLTLVREAEGGGVFFSDGAGI
jgi:hypothetical protein